MEPAGQEDDERLRLGIDPQARPRESRMAQAGGPEQLAAWAAVARLHVPAKASPLTGRCRAGVEHGADGEGPDQPAAVPGEPPIQECLGEDGDVVGRGEEAGVPGHAAEGPRPRVMDGPPEHRLSRALRARSGQSGRRRAGPWDSPRKAAGSGRPSCLRPRRSARRANSSSVWPETRSTSLPRMRKPTSE